MRGGVAGVLSAIFLEFLLYVMAFMIAFGNPTPYALIALSFLGVLLSFPASILILAAGYVLGAFILFRR